MYKHILYATDFSKSSLATEKKVASLASQTGSKLSIIHVVNYGSTAWAGAGGYFVLTELHEETLKEGKKALSACADRLSIELTHTHAVQGSPKEEIVKYAEEIGADLIALGSHGHYHLSDVLGTTASGVLQKAPCDVLVVQSGGERET